MKEVDIPFEATKVIDRLRGSIPKGERLSLEELASLISAAEDPSNLVHTLGGNGKNTPEILELLRRISRGG